MKTKIGFARSPVVVVVLILGGGCGAEEHLETGSSQRAMYGGTILTAGEELRSGIVGLQIPTTLGAGLCSGSILRTSLFRQETFVLSAAHCFANWSGAPVSVGSDIVMTRPFGSTTQVTIHPDFDNDSTGRMSRDVAILRLPNAVAIDQPNGKAIMNWYRPIFGYSPKTVNASHEWVMMFGAGAQDENPVSIDGSIRHMFGEEYSDVDDANIGLDDDDPAVEGMGGDSGGPWLTAYGTNQTTGELIDHGVIIGVTSGQYIDDEYATSTFAPSVRTFIQAQAGDSAILAGSNTWRRPCFVDWCHLRTNEAAALIQAVLYY